MNRNCIIRRNDQQKEITKIELKINIRLQTVSQNMDHLQKTY